MGSCCGVYFCVNKFYVGKPRPLPYTQPGDRPRGRVRRDDCRLVEKRGSCGLWATHQLDAARELRQTRGPSQPHPTATSCHPQRWRTPTPTFPTAGLPESNRSNPTQRDDGGFRQSDHLRPCPQLLLHMVPAPAHLPRASMWSRERYPPRLHHHPRPPPPASRPASSACVSGTA